MTKIIQRHDTAANWTSVNPVLAQGEMGIETDTRKFKFGDGTTAWTDLAYASSEGGGEGTSYTFTDGIVNNNNIVGLSRNLYSKSLTLNTVGTPTLNNEFIGSGFTDSSYFTSKSFLDGTEDSWEMCFKFDFATAGQNNQGILDSDTTIGQNIRLTISSADKLFLRINSSLSSNTYALNLTGSTTLSVNTIYYVKIKYSNSTGYEMYLSTNGTDYTLDASSTTTTKLLYSTTVVWLYGRNAGSTVFTGSIYFEDSYIIRNNTERISFVNTFSDYSKSLNKPKINGVVLDGSKTAKTLKLEPLINKLPPIIEDEISNNVTKNITISGDNIQVASASSYSVSSNLLSVSGIYAGGALQPRNYIMYNFTKDAVYFIPDVVRDTTYGNSTYYILGTATDEGVIPKIAVRSNYYVPNSAYILGDYNSSSDTSVLYNILSTITKSEVSWSPVAKQYDYSAIFIKNNKMYLPVSGGHSSNGSWNYSFDLSSLGNEYLSSIDTLLVMYNSTSSPYANATMARIFNGAMDISSNGLSSAFDNSTPIDLSNKVINRQLKLLYDKNTLKVNSSGELEAIPQETPIATTNTAGIVKPDGTTISVTEDGTISSIPPANMITSENIASDATIVGLNDAIEMAQGDVNTLASTVSPLVNGLSNCLLEIPQRIKYTLENGTLTIKASSVFIVPFGTEDKTSQYTKGSIFLNDNFKVYDTQFVDGKFFVWAELQNDISYNAAYTSSVPCTLTVNLETSEIMLISLVDTGLSYNTSTNFVIHTNISGTVSLPCMLCTRDTTGVGSIQQVFNGMGYIGSIAWVDKGVKALFADGINLDGTLKNKEIVNNTLTTFDTDGTTSLLGRLDIDNNKIKISGYGTVNYFEQGTPPKNFATHAIWYNIRENRVYITSDGGTTWTKIYCIVFHKLIKSSPTGSISDITIPSTVKFTTVGSWLGMYPKVLVGSGKIVNASGDTTEGVGNFTLTLYNNGKCRIDFVFKITTAGTAASNFNWGISPALLKAINPDIPNITPTHGGYVVYLNSNGAKDDSLNNYGGRAAGSSDGSRWTFGRIYQTTGEFGGWNSAKFPVGTFVYGCAIGTFNINEV